MRSIVMLLALAAFASAQECPYTVQFESYGEGCSVVTSQSEPTLVGGFEGQGGCFVGIDYTVPPACCNVLLSQQVLIVGFSETDVPFPNGCSLLAAPDLLVILPPTIGTLSLQSALPADPALSGAELFLQATIVRLTTIGGTKDREFSAGLRMSFL